MPGDKRTRNLTGLGGVGLTFVSTLLPFGWPDMPLFVVYIGIAVGAILMVLDWGPRVLSAFHIPDMILFQPFISLNEAATYAFTELHEVNSVMARFAKEAGKADDENTLNWMADFVNSSVGYEFSFYGKYSPSTKRGSIPKQSVRNGRFTNGARKLILHPHHEWVDLEVKKRDWETVVQNLRDQTADSGPSRA